jgi:hypothetical protein
MPWWHATLALGARVACLGPEMDPFKRFRDPNVHFESLGTQLEQRYKFRDLGFILLFEKLGKYGTTSNLKHYSYGHC